METATKEAQHTAHIDAVTAKAENAYQQKSKERESKILCTFLNELQGAICADPYIENVPQDIYLDIQGKNTLEIAEYLYKKIKKEKGKHLRGTDLKTAYEYWIIVLFEKMLYVYPYDKDYNAKEISGWIIKQLNTHADKYQTIAFVKALRKIWLNGGFGKEYKEYVKEMLEQHGEETYNYGIFKAK